MPYIYILHFHTRLSHAEHYIGSTSNLKQRLAAHAAGRGSRLTRELVARKIPFTLTNLYETSQRNLLRLERKLKDQHNGPRHCPLCNTATLRPPPGCQQYDIHLVPFAIDSRQIDAASPIIEIKRQHQLTAETDLCIALQRTEKQLGHITKAGYVDHWKAGNITTAWADDQPIGYTLHTLNQRNNHIRIHQCGVLDEHRLIGVARSLVETIRWRYPMSSVSCKVRSDLAANHFWTSIGFERSRTTKHPTSNSALNHYTISPKL